VPIGRVRFSRLIVSLLQPGHYPIVFSSGPPLGSEGMGRRLAKTPHHHADAANQTHVNNNIGARQWAKTIPLSVVTGRRVAVTGARTERGLNNDVRVEDRSAALVKPRRKGPPCTYHFRRRWRSDEAPTNAGNLIRKGRLPGTMPVATRPLPRLCTPIVWHHRRAMSAVELTQEKDDCFRRVIIEKPFR
jgi:hypothetical protein